MNNIPVLTENSQEIKNIIKNYNFDYTQYYLSRSLKFVINFILVYLFVSYILNYNDDLTQNEMILIICTYVSVLLYLLDSNFPSCYVNLC
jgi:hypothetical protein